MKHTINTGLNRDRSKVVIGKAMESYVARFADYNPRFAWTGDGTASFGFQAKGISLGGTIAVHDQRVEVDMEVPFLLRVFQGKAISVIEEQVKEWVAKEQRGEITG